MIKRGDPSFHTDTRILDLGSSFRDFLKMLNVPVGGRQLRTIKPQARETPPQAPQEPPKPIRTKKALTDRFKTRLDERLAENERKQAEKQAEPDMEETWDLSDPADPLNIGMGWGTGGHGLGL